MVINYSTQDGSKNSADIDAFPIYSVILSHMLSLTSEAIIERCSKKC